MTCQSMILWLEKRSGHGDRPPGAELQVAITSVSRYNPVPAGDRLAIICCAADKRTSRHSQSESQQFVGRTRSFRVRAQHPVVQVSAPFINTNQRVIEQILLAELINLKNPLSSSVTVAGHKAGLFIFRHTSTPLLYLRFQINSLLISSTREMNDKTPKKITSTV